MGNDMKYETLDSGERVEYPSGMVRDVADDKPRYDLIPLGPLKRLAELYTRGAEKYGDRNWEQADSPVEVQRFKASALRHMYQYLAGEQDEDHMVAVVFNLFAAEHTQAKWNPFTEMHSAMQDQSYAKMGFLDEALAKINSAKKRPLRSTGEKAQEGPLYHEAIKGE
jgi:hypothetical protein